LVEFSPLFFADRTPRRTKKNDVHKIFAT